MARTMRLDGSPVELDESSHDRQTETESFSRPFDRWICLPKGRKDRRERRGVNADARVGDFDLDMSIGVPQGDRDTATGRCKFDSISHQVPKNLLEPNSVAAYRCLFTRQASDDLDVPL